MPAGTNFKLRADIGQYKQSMNEAKAATKTLDAEMKLAQTQFKATGDAENYLQQRTRILAQQITQQEKAAKNARDAMAKMAQNGIEPSNVEFQKMSRTALEAEEQLARLRMEAGRTGDELLRSGESAGKMSQVMDTLKGMTPFASITAGFAAVRSIVSEVSNKVEELKQRLYESASWADEISTTSARYGLSTKELQQWEQAAKYAETDVDTILKARDKLLAKMDTDTRSLEAQLVTATGKERQKLLDEISAKNFLVLDDGFKQYAITLKDTEGQMRDSMEVFWDLIDVLGQVENATARDQLAQEYFGKSFRDIETLIQNGREGWNKYAQEASTVSQESIDALNQVQDAKDRYEHELEVFQKNQDARRAEQAQNSLNRKAAWLHFANTGELQQEARTDVENVRDAVQAYGNWVDETFPWLANLKKSLKGEGEDDASEAGADVAKAFATGAEANAELAASAGAALAAAIVNAFASVTPSGSGSVTNNTTNQNFGNTFVLDASMSPDLNAAILANHLREQAGYGVGG